MIGLTIGNYRVTRKLGEGGMGAVFEAQHASIGRRAAIKVLHPAYAGNSDVVGRFFNEARAANLIAHPGMVAVFDYGLLDDGTAYLVMELLVGETLSARQERAGGRLGRDALRFGRQIAGALGAAHAAGIVHRDLKPDNVMVVADPEAAGGERVKVLDFGIAKLAEHHAMTSAGHTRTGAVMGTPLYMSPEQCRGAGAVDDRADVYALGAMLYHQLSGRPVFDAEGTGAMLAMHIYEAPVPLGEMVPGLAPEIADVVHRMLAKEPRVRPAMPEVEVALAALLAGAPLPAGDWHAPLPPGPAPRTTLSGASGVRTAPPPTFAERAGGKRPWRAVLIAGGAVAAAGAGAAVMAASGGDGGRAGTSTAASLGPPAAPAPAPAPAPVVAPAEPAPTVRTVRWIITSDPAGAEIQDPSGASLGITPKTLERPAAAGMVTLHLVLAGHRTQELKLDGNRDAAPSVGMPREHTSRKPPRGSAGTAAPADPYAAGTVDDLARPTTTVTTPPPVEHPRGDDDFERRLENQKKKSAGDKLTAKPVE